MAKKYLITCTAFDAKGRVIGAGINSYTKTHPLAKHFSVLAGESEDKCMVHAELAAMLSAGSRKVYSVGLIPKVGQCLQSLVGAVRPC